MSYADTIVKDKDLESNIKKFVLLYNNKKEDIDKVGFFKYHFFNLINKLFLKFGSKKFAQKNFEIDSNKCNKCMTCEKICPVDNIKVNGEVKFTDKCQACQACINWCPKDAIKYKKPGIYKPYKNKDIKLKEILK
jgi:NAD-dependent dihydropyrimidine dehydrogenase PreA subunit